MENKKENYYREIGQRIRNARKEKNITLDKLGDMIGIKKSRLSLYENGKVRSFSIDLVKKIATALGVSPESLLGWNSSNSSKDLKDLFQGTEVLFDGATYPMNEEKRKMIAWIIKAATDKEIKNE